MLRGRGLSPSETKRLQSFPEANQVGFVPELNRCNRDLVHQDKTLTAMSMEDTDTLIVTLKMSSLLQQSIGYSQSHSPLTFALHTIDLYEKDGRRVATSSRCTKRSENIAEAAAAILRC